MLAWGQEVIILLYGWEDLTWPGKNSHQNLCINCIKMVVYCVNLSKTMAGEDAVKSIIRDSLG